MLKKFVPYVGIAPSVGLFSIFLLFPVGFAIVTSLFRWSGVGPVEGFVGLGNYAKLILYDNIFRISFYNTCVLSGASLLSQVLLGFLIAFLIGKVRFRTFFRVVLLLPLALPMVAVGITWNMIFIPSIGLFNLVMENIPGLSSIAKTVWLGNPKTALLSIVITYTWQYLGLYVIIFLAALQGVPSSLYEIAEIEGAGSLQQLVYITIPLLRSSFFVCMMLCIVLTARLFPIVYVMTKGGPGRATEILGYTIHQYGFRFFRAGEANAIAVILIGFVIILTMVLTRLVKGQTEGLE